MLFDSFQKQLHIASANANITPEMAGADDPMYDLVIKNGQIVDGTGNTSFQGDIGIKDGLVAKVANADQGEAITDCAKETIHAAGAIVSPGWVDTHSHMDGQATWDPYCSPANHHGQRFRYTDLL